MRVYRTSILLVLIFAIVYPLVSIGVLAVNRRTAVIEVYPFAPWNLFCFIPNRESDYSVRLKSLDGHPRENDVFLEEYAKLPEKQKIVAYNVIQRMGDLYEQGMTEAFEQQRSFFESSFLRLVAHSARYELVRQDFDVLQRWKTGELDHVEPLVEFDYRDDSEAEKT